MKRTAVIGNVKPSQQELKGLEMHFRQIRDEAVLATLKRTPAATLDQLHKLLTQTRPSDEPPSNPDATVPGSSG